MTITVTAATGHLGHLIVEQLLARGVAASEIIATARSQERLTALTDLGVGTAIADYDDQEGMEEAFAGTDTLVLVSGSEIGQRARQHANAIKAAEVAGVTHIVYTSAPRADTSKLFVAPEHKATEELLAATPVEATVLRNNWYNENYEQALAQIAATGTYLASTGTGKVASAARSDYAEAAAVVAATNLHRGQTLELAGDTAWDGAQFAATASRVLGRDVAYANASPDEHRKALTEAGFDEDTIGFLVGLDAAIADHQLDGPSTVLSELIGHPTTTLEQTFRTYHA
jgi:NAD(P)H dehydrogenase (quinone)